MPTAVAFQLPVGLWSQACGDMSWSVMPQLPGLGVWPPGLGVWPPALAATARPPSSAQAARIGLPPDLLWILLQAALEEPEQPGAKKRLPPLVCCAELARRRACSTALGR